MASTTTHAPARRWPVMLAALAAAAAVIAAAVWGVSRSGAPPSVMREAYRAHTDALASESAQRPEPAPGPALEDGAAADVVDAAWQRIAQDRLPLYELRYEVTRLIDPSDAAQLQPTRDAPASKAGASIAARDAACGALGLPTAEASAGDPMGGWSEHACTGLQQAREAGVLELGLRACRQRDMRSPLHPSSAAADDGRQWHAMGLAAALSDLLILQAFIDGHVGDPAAGVERLACAARLGRDLSQSAGILDMAVSASVERNAYRALATWLVRYGSDDAEALQRAWDELDWLARVPGPSMTRAGRGEYLKMLPRLWPNGSAHVDVPPRYAGQQPTAAPSSWVERLLYKRTARAFHRTWTEAIALDTEPIAARLQGCERLNKAIGDATDPRSALWAHDFCEQTLTFASVDTWRGLAQWVIADAEHQRAHARPAAAWRDFTRLVPPQRDTLQGKPYTIQTDPDGRRYVRMSPLPARLELHVRDARFDRFEMPLVR